MFYIQAGGSLPSFLSWLELATWKQELEYPKEFNIQMEQTIKGVTGQGQQGHWPGQVWVRHVVHC